MKEKRLLFLGIVGLSFCFVDGIAAEAIVEKTQSSAVASYTTTTRTVTTTTEVVQEKKKSWNPLKVAVLDFSSADVAGGKRFLSGKNQKIEIPAQCTLNAEDRKSIDRVMQGYVRMIDAWDQSGTNSANRHAQMQDNDRKYRHARELYQEVVKGQSRPMVLGAEYLGAYLGRHGDVFNCVDSALVTQAMAKIAAQPDFPRDFLRKIGQETGVTHLIYGTVSDLRSKETSFKGYGIETKNTNYQLDVIIKVVDLQSQQTVFSNVFTGSYREQKNGSGTQLNNNIYQSLMTSALEQAAEELYEVSKPGPDNRISAPATVR